MTFKNISKAFISWVLGDSIKSFPDPFPSRVLNTLGLETSTFEHEHCTNQPYRLILNRDERAPNNPLDTGSENIEGTLHDILVLQTLSSYFDLFY